MIVYNRCARLFLFAFRRYVVRQKIPLLASFKLTYRCNLACLACPYHHRSGETGGHMSREKALQSLKTLQDAGTAIVVFEGGEPFLWHDGSYGLEDLIRYARQRFFRVAVTTNGTFPLTSTADILWVSLDGLEANHDRLRSRSFNLAWKNLQASGHQRLFVHYTINRQNRNDIRPLLERLRGIKAFKGLTLQLFYPYDQGEAPLALTGPERQETLEAVIDLKRRGFPILNSIGRLQGMIRNDWRCHEDILINVDPDGTVTPGCYVKNRGAVNCLACGFTPVAEASGAVDMIPGSLWAGLSIFR